MEKSNFDQLLQRYLEGNVSDAEKRKIEAWLEIRKTKNATDLELSPTQEEQLFKKIISSQDNIKELEEFVPKKKSLWDYRTFGIAASLLLLVAASFGLWKTGPLKSFSGTDIEKLILNDGTLVWLKAGSKLTYYQKQDGTRYTELQGQGLFEVAKDPQHPFIINCGMVNIKVTGTSFNLRSSDDTVELQVLTGNVFISDSAGGIAVAAHEKVVYTPATDFSKSTLNTVEVMSITEGTEYSMSFDNSSLQDVFRQIENKFDVRVRIEDNEIRKCRITADLTDQSLEKTLQMITEILDVHFDRNGKDIVVTGKSCM